jgi:hypothetical protein
METGAGTPGSGATATYENAVNSGNDAGSASRRTYSFATRFSAATRGRVVVEVE